MPIKNFPFLCIPKDDFPRPWLAIRLINSHTGLFIDTFGLVDTGADNCAVPAFFAEELGHTLKKGLPKTVRTAGGLTTAYSHRTQVEIYDIRTKKCVYAIKETSIDFMPNLHCVLLGVKDFLAQFELHINYPKFIFSIRYPKRGKRGVF